MNNGVSIIIPAWKTESFIADSLKSIYEQSWIKEGGEYEVLVGVDACYKTLVAAQKNTDEKTGVYWFANHSGAYVIRNTLIKKAKYDHLLMFDSDDIAHPDLIKNSFDYDNSLVRYGFKMPSGAAGKTFGIHFMPKGLYKKYGGYQAWECAADADFVNRVNAGKDKSVVIDNENYITRGVHPNQLTKRHETGMKSELRASYKKITEQQIEKKELYVEPVIADCVECNTKKEIQSSFDKFISCKEWVNGVEVGPVENIIACAAWRKGEIYREASFQFVKSKYGEMGIPVYLGTSDGSLFNRGASRNAAVNQGLKENPNTDTIILFDTDTHVDKKQVFAAVNASRSSGNIVYAFTSWCKTNTNEAERIITGGKIEKPKHAYNNIVGGVMALPLSLWNAIGGYDERFESWGGEDRAFFYSCCAYTGNQEPLRVCGNAIHLWHPKSSEVNSGLKEYRFNQELTGRYKKASGRYDKEGFTEQIDSGGMVAPDKTILLKILKEEGGPLSGAKPKGRVCNTYDLQCAKITRWVKTTGKTMYAIEGTELYSRLQKDSKWTLQC